jgi:hypothetical protein
MRTSSCECLLLALSGQSNHAHVCPLSDQSGQRLILTRDGLSAYDAVDGAYAVASRWRRMGGLKREIQRADVDAGGMKNASGQIGQTNW